MTRLRDAIPDALVLFGLTAVAVAAGLLAVPAGLAVGGIEAVVLGVVLNLDRAQRTPADDEAPARAPVDDSLTVERVL